MSLPLNTMYVGQVQQESMNNTLTPMNETLLARDHQTPRKIGF